MKHAIHFDSSADGWSQGLLLGNGHMGAVVYGGIKREQIELSEITFFSGDLSYHNNQEKAAEAFRQMRHLVSKGAYREAAEMAKNFIGIRHNYGTNLPVGKLIIDFATKDEPVVEYKRELNIMEGIATVAYKKGEISYKREAFISNPAKKFLYKISTDREKQISCKIHFDGGMNPYETRGVGDKYIFTTNAYETIHSDGQTGVKLQGIMTVQVNCGEVVIDETGIKVSAATEVILSLQMETDYNKAFSLCNDMRKEERELSYEVLKKEHREDLFSYMSRVDLSLQGSDDQTELMFQYGRYLLLSSSRKDSPLPTHLQGVWNDNVACRIGWTCDMHLDINTQMNYWLSEPGNLAECHMPLFRWMEEKVIPSGRLTAKLSYGMPGWSADLVSNAWGYSAPYWSRTISPCPTGGIWMASDYWEHYLYTQDKAFLEKQAFPVLEEAVAFFLAYVFKEGEYYTCGPSISPENSFIVDKERFHFSNGCTYEVLMIRELFQQYLAGAKVLGVRKNLVKNVAHILPKLLPYRVLGDGSLAEWNHDYPSGDSQHRHTSHLLGLFPYSQITPEKTPELVKAAEKSLAQKLSPYENWEDTGWARSMLMLYEARLKNGEAAYEHIRSMQTHLTHPNYLVMHPPTRGADSFQEVYELDGNTGFSMCVIELLMQSHDGIIQLLPALPKAWEKGFVKGIVARGGIIVNIFWEDGGLKKAEFTANQAQCIDICYKGHKESIMLTEGKTFVTQVLPKPNKESQR